MERMLLKATNKKEEESWIAQLKYFVHYCQCRGNKLKSTNFTSEESIHKMQTGVWILLLFSFI